MPRTTRQMTPAKRGAQLLAAVTLPGGGSSDFDLNPGIVLPAGRTLRAAAVLVGVAEGPNGPSVLLTMRSSRLRHHPGQIAFPGGKRDEDDPSLEATALREAWEEVGLPASAVKIIGSLPCHETVTGFTVTPILARISEPFTPVPEAGEVAEVFQVPLSHLIDPNNFRVESRRWRGERRHYVIVPYGPYYIWGATARILRGLAERMSE